MRMSIKMILLFSIVTAFLIAINTTLFIHSELRTLELHEAESLSVIANQMKTEIEQNITFMVYDIEKMTQNSDFLSALATIQRLGEQGEHTPDYLKAQNTLSSLLYHQPINDHFYSVNVITNDGFILSSHFQKFEIAESYSDEVVHSFAALPWLQEPTASLSDRQVITPHKDPWAMLSSASKSISVYTVWAYAIYHGAKIGYVEVNALADDLNEIFSISGMSGFQAAAIFSDRTNDSIRELFRETNNTIAYENVPIGEMVTCTDAQGNDYYVVAAYSKSLGLTIYAAQRKDVYASSVQATVWEHVFISLMILSIAVVIIILLSMGLTHSITRLTKKISTTRHDALLTESVAEPLTVKKVTRTHDQEVRAMEDTFDDLLLSLRESIQSEVCLRESTLHSELNALQAQINPHFIYNTLNIISAKSMEAGNEEIIEICDCFAQMLRYSTNLVSKTATLQEEIENARTYLLLVKARYEDKLTYQIDVPSIFLKQTLPKLSLQPIIENAISHGYQGSCGSIRIDVTGRADENNLLHLIIRDNGCGFDQNVLKRLNTEFARIENGELASPSDTGAHIGLVNTYRRLFYFSHGGIKMLLRNEDGAVIEMIVDSAKKER